MREETFSFFLPIEVSSSIQKANGKGSSKEDTYASMTFRGVASVAVEDGEGEILDPQGFDLSLFKWINWEHDNSAENIIGCVTKSVITEKALDINGKLFPHKAKAREVWDIARSLESDKDFSGTRLGLSIEGKVLERDPDNSNIVTKAKLFKVAICTTPMNSLTFMEVVKSHFKPSINELSKSDNMDANSKATLAQAFKNLNVSYKPVDDLAKAQKSDGEGDNGEGDNGTMSMEDVVEFISNLLDKGWDEDKIMDKMAKMDEYSDMPDSERKEAYEKACKKMKKGQYADPVTGTSADADASKALEFLQNRFGSLEKAVSSKTDAIAQILSVVIETQEALMKSQEELAKSQVENAKILNYVKDELEVSNAMPRTPKSNFKPSPNDDVNKSQGGASTTSNNTAQKGEPTVLDTRVSPHKKKVQELMKKSLPDVKPFILEQGILLNETQVAILEKEHNVRIVQQ